MKLARSEARNRLRISRSVSIVVKLCIFILGRPLFHGRGRRSARHRANRQVRVLPPRERYLVPKAFPSNRNGDMITSPTRCPVVLATPPESPELASTARDGALAGSRASSEVEA